MRHVIVHGHIFKNAGSTLDWSLDRSFGSAFLDHRDDAAMRQGRALYLARLLRDAPHLLALSSHFLCCPLPEVDGLRLHPVYLLRHPIERFASVYAFERRQDAPTRGARAAKEKTFAEYVAWRLRKDVRRTLRDYQVSHIAGRHDAPAELACPVAWIRTAFERIEACECIGVVDRYDESMLVFEARLSAVFPGLDLAYVAQNVSANVSPIGAPAALAARVRAVLDDLGELAAEAIGHNSYDLALYRCANQKLDAALAALNDVEDRLAAFRERCARLRR